MNEPAAAVAVRVWDLPTRLFHWLLAVLVVALIVTGHVGGNALNWHLRLGMLVMMLLVFRLLWGVLGGRWSRFTSFVRGPGTVLRYLRGQTAPSEHLDVGHNPLGALSVLALLVVLAVQVATGLVADDEIATTGPLNKLVSTARGLQATAWHTEVGQWLLVALVLLHVGAILFYKLKKGKDLVGPMLRGDKVLPEAVPASADGWLQRLLGLAVLAASVALGWWIWQLGG